jgi:hypothetical protein
MRISARAEAKLKTPKKNKKASHGGGGRTARIDETAIN